MWVASATSLTTTKVMNIHDKQINGGNVYTLYYNGAWQINGGNVYTLYYNGAWQINGGNVYTLYYNGAWQNLNGKSGMDSGGGC